LPLLPPADREVVNILAIDPGLNGALAWVRDDLSIVEIEDMPLVGNEVNAKLVFDLIAAYGRIKIAVVERQQAFPKQGASSGFKLGVSYGATLGVLAAMQVPVALRTPSEWKPRLKLSRDKERSRQAALQRWPAESSRFHLKKHEGRAEAALLGVSYLLEMGQVNTNGRRTRVG
jgi:crossover junction endodeoxyribonuclease RuvC